MESEWDTSNLGSIAKLRGGTAFKTKFQGHRTGQFPFIKVSDMNAPENGLYITSANNWVDEETRQFLKGRLHPPGSVVFATVGIALTYNRRRLLVYDTIIDNNMMAAVPNDGLIDYRFLYYILLNTDFNMYAEGSALPFLKASTLNEIPFLLPPLAEQQRIAAVLGALDDKIELNRKVNRTLEEMAQALFKSWFIDFDGHTDLVPSELGPIPQGWEVRCFNDLLIESREKIGNLDAPEYSLTNLGLIPRSELFKKKLAKSSAKNKLIQRSYLVFGLSRRVLNFGLMSEHAGSVSSAYKVFTPKPDSLSTTFIERYMRRRHDFYYTILGASSREGQSIDTRSFLERKVLAPPLQTLCAYENQMTPLFARITSNIAESQTLAQLRDTLLPKLISGEIRVPETEQQLESVL